MHVILKPIIKLMLWLVVIFGALKLAGVDVEPIISQAQDALGGLADKLDAEE